MNVNKQSVVGFFIHFILETVFEVDVHSPLLYCQRINLFDTIIVCFL